jgi:hypothetical protein
VNGHRVLVESTCITSATFSSELNVLQLEFRNGLSYEYFGVPAELYRGLLSAPSKGAFVSRFIRGRFPYRRLEQQWI